MPAFGRRRRQEIATWPSDVDPAERHITGLYAEAVEQLGSDRGTVRSGGLYALERLAQDCPAYRQAVVDVICAYLRMPFSSTAPVSGQKEPGTEGEMGTDGIGGAWQQERQVRLTAQSILAEHLRDDRGRDRRSSDLPSSRFWNNIRLDLTGATLIDFNLVNAVMADVSFYGAAFTGDASFSGATFSGAARFGGAAFGGDASFSGATFSGAAQFGGTAFDGDALFGGAAFGLTADFPEAAFGGDALFGGAAFSRDAGFRRAVFGGAARFRRAVFGGAARFRRAAFTGDAGFGETAFGGDAWFDKATFSRDASFGEAAFDGDAGFGEASFGSDAWFDKATFSRRVSFGEAVFGGGAGFGEAAFGAGAWFDEAIFSGGADALQFEQARILAPDASDVWPVGWRLADADGGGYTVVRVNDDDGSGG